MFHLYLTRKCDSHFIKYMYILRWSDLHVYQNTHLLTSSCSLSFSRSALRASFLSPSLLSFCCWLILELYAKRLQIMTKISTDVYNLNGMHNHTRWKFTVKNEFVPSMYSHVYIYDYMWNQLEYTAPEVGVTMTQIKTLTIRDLGSRVGPMNFNEVPCIPVDPTCVYTYF